MFVAPFLIGLASSLHCIGMCSPLVIAVSRPGKNAIFRNLEYNAGRIVTYALLGAIVSFIGKGFSIVGIQQWVSIGTGIGILFIGLTSMRITAPVFVTGSIGKFTSSL